MGRLSGDFLRSFCFNTFDARCSRRFLCRAPALSHCLCQASALYRSCRSPALSASGAQRVRAPTPRAPRARQHRERRAPTQRAPAGRRSPTQSSGAGRHRERESAGPTQRRPGALCVKALVVSVSGPALSASGPGAPGALSLSVRSAGALSVGPGALCTGALSVSGALCASGSVRSRCSVSGPAARCVGPHNSLCVGPRRSGALCVRTQRSLRGTPCLCVGPGAVSGPGALCVGAGALCGPQLQSARHPSIRSRGPPAPIRVPYFSGDKEPLQTGSACHPSDYARAPPIRSAGPQLRSACHPSCPAGENPKPYCLGENVLRLVLISLLVSYSSVMLVFVIINLYVGITISTRTRVAVNTNVSMSIGLGVSISNRSAIRINSDDHDVNQYSSVRINVRVSVCLHTCPILVLLSILV